MPSDKQYRAALAALAQELGMDSSALAAQEAAVIDEITVVFVAVKRAGTDAMQIACKVAPLPYAPPLALLRQLLQANTLGSATGGATLGLQNAADNVVLASVHPLDTPTPALARACRTLAEIATVWAAALGQGQSFEQPAASLI